MSSRLPIIFHIMATDLCGRPVLMQVPAKNGREALTKASRCGTELVVLFATREIEKESK
jgi:hypothetical protein